jgi:hypothetical protein
MSLTIHAVEVCPLVLIFRKKVQGVLDFIVQIMTLLEALFFLLIILWKGKLCICAGRVSQMLNARAPVPIGIFPSLAGGDGGSCLYSVIEA